MSAYVVDEEVIHQILACISPTEAAKLARQAGIEQPRTTDHKPIRFVGDTKNENDLYSRIGKAMMDLNVEAVAYRYRENPEPSVYTYKVCVPDRKRGYRSLRTWLYQCTEGEFDSSALYRAMQELSNEWAHDMLGSFFRTGEL